MSDLRWRLRFGDRPASMEEMGRVEEITIEQEIDMIWQASIRLTLCMDDRGRWRQGPRSLAQPFDRVRIEVGVDRRFVPLIDGPVARIDAGVDSRPGQSSLTLVVRDDSALLNRDDDVEVFENRADHEVAREIFGRFPSIIADTRIETTEGTPPATVRRETPMRFLRKLARVHGFHAYVLPGEEPGSSIGCFRPRRQEGSGLPPLVAAGQGRNLVDVTFRDDPELPIRSRTRTLRLDDASAESWERSSTDRQLLQDLPTLPPGTQPGLRRLDPQDAVREDGDVTTQGRAEARRWSNHVEGRLVPGCYPAALRPYETVQIRAGTLPWSGSWVLTRVVHTLTPGAWTQQFEAESDGLHDLDAAPLTGPGGGLSVDAAADLSLF